MNDGNFNQLLRETLEKETSAEEYVLRKNLTKKRVLSGIQSTNAPVWFFKIRYMLPLALLLLTVGLILISRLDLMSSRSSGSYSEGDNDTLLSQLTDPADMNSVEEDQGYRQDEDFTVDQNQQPEREDNGGDVLSDSSNTLSSGLLITDAIAEITTLVSDLNEVQNSNPVTEPELNGLLNYVGVDTNGVAMISLETR
ncbi:MAG: hypothetical protein ACE5DX_04885 [Candidatus Dojkabacteria bacterium]